MKIYERVTELDRLYLTADALTNSANNATTVEASKHLHRRARVAWRKYYALRDSNRGLPNELRKQP